MITNQRSTLEHDPFAAAPLMPFRLASERALHFPEFLRTREAADFLANLVRREPTNLRVHSQRILLHADRLEKEPLFGALLDLFSVLGEKGFALRQSMLASAKGLIDESPYQYLAASLESGLMATAKMPEAPFAILWQGGRLPATLVGTRKAEQRIERLDPVSEARDCIDHGQLEMAQEILERAARADPGNQDVALELLGIFAYAGNALAQRTFLDSLGNEANFCPAWREAKRLPHIPGGYKDDKEHL